MELYGADKALYELQLINDKKKLESYYLYHSLLGEIYSRINNFSSAKQHFETAIKLTHSETERKMLKNKILVLLN
jgi:RNA polymerase sigma-70 factor (ECF subfamily)